ncbi:MAG: NifU family protein [Alphaproteobacteria bacterium]|nr:NifU family protein [Alphaproteobacteria bacterium]
MFIQTENTPNPNSMKFIPGTDVSPSSPVNFTSNKDCAQSPLAESLFKLQYVEGVFLGKDFVTITKQPNTDWNLVKPEILLLLMEFFSSGKPAIVDSKENQEVSTEKDSDVVAQIKEIIEEKVRPAVAQDGGDIIFHSFEKGIVKLELHGACSGCPSSTVTLKNGIENMLKHYVPEVIEVEAVDNELA